MFRCLVIVSMAVAIISSLPVEQQYPRFIDFPGDDGAIHKVDLEEKPDVQALSQITRNPANNLYLLFTRRNPTFAQTLVMNDEESVTNSHFDASLPTVVIVHGWLSNQNTDINVVIRDAYLAIEDVNIIVLDWKRLANKGYVTAAKGVPALGRGLGQFLEFINRVTGAPYSNMHLIGFSLGAHLVGNAGRHLRGRVGRITGLDPAGPLWVYNSERLSASDAVYVEGIHTNGGVAGLGLGTAVGHADFFPNGGNSQPGCLTPICDHNRAWELYAASVAHNHLIATECKNNVQITMNSCRGPSVLHMGNGDFGKRGSGKYRVNTRRRYPF